MFRVNFKIDWYDLLAVQRTFQSLLQLQHLVILISTVASSMCCCSTHTTFLFIRKDPDAGRDGRQEEQGTTEDRMVGWHHRLDGHEFEQAPGDGGGQGSLACCSPWVAESDMAERLNSCSTYTINPYMWLSEFMENSVYFYFSRRNLS